jgi:hypothetical protein
VLGGVMLASGLGSSACGSKKRQAPPPVVSAPPVRGLEALPAGTLAVVGANVAKLGAAPIVRDAFQQMFARAPGVAERLSALMTRCKLDPQNDLDTVVVGLMGTTTARDVVLVATGRFEEAAIETCVRVALTEPGKGGALDKREIDGVTVYVARGTASSDVAFSFGAPDTLIIADSEALLARARSPKEPRLGSDGPLMALIGRTDTSAALWGAGMMDAKVGQGLVQTFGLSGPAKAIWGRVELGQGLDVGLSVELASAADASALLEITRRQLVQYGVLAQPLALGAVVAKITPTSEGPEFRVSVVLDRDDLARVQKVLSGKPNPGSIPGGKEGAEP